MKITQKHIDKLLNQSEKDVRTIFDKVTQVTVKLPDGYVLSESMGCIDKDNYSQKVGYDICMQRIENKLWDLEGYAANKSMMEHRFTDKDIIHEDKRLKPNDLTVEQRNRCMKNLKVMLRVFLNVPSSDYRNKNNLYRKVVQLEDEYHLESLADTIKYCVDFDSLPSTETCMWLSYSPCTDTDMNIMDLIKKWDGEDYTNY